MKTTKIINGLTVEFENNRTNVILVERHIDCSTLDSATFTKYITEDLLRADKIYSDMREPFIRKEHENRIKQHEDNIRRIADLKYKRQSSKDKFIEQEFATIKRDADYKSTLSFVDFKPEDSALGISSCCVLPVDNVEDIAPNCFEVVKDNKYFKNAKGWVIKYETLISTVNGVVDYGLRNSFRAYVETILDNDLQKERDNRWSETVNSVAHFYEGCTYFGD